MKDDLGDRMKHYETTWAGLRAYGELPMIARLDGRKFSKFSEGFKKPFDDRLTAAMNQATRELLKETYANIAYTQSDEITLIWDAVSGESQRFFDGRLQKLCSVLAGKCTIEFNWALMETLPVGSIQRSKLQVSKPHFDCRVWLVPDQGEAANTLLWRSQDARRNGISVFCQQHVSHNGLHGLNQEQMLEAAYANGAPDINLACKTGELFGRYFQRGTERRQMSDQEYNDIPVGSRPPRDMQYARSVVKQLDIAYFGDVGDQEARIDVIFK